MNIVKIPLQMHGDERGLLVAIEENRHIPFNIKRVYYMYDTQTKVRRGYHAHKKTTQVAIVLKGSCKFLFDDGYTKQDITLDNPAVGLLIEPLVWHEMYDFSDDCILMVLADDFYDESDYIRNYDDFVKSVC
ncbi:MULTISPECIES: sugar 3,4-ketoisomerase [Enterobacter]|jgi:dTDP-4-dehydrorhamnose 3,5-epimerase-like enzyme|uniref:sugar 3,4-ketoisomerase n=1 Tax=Enterobacter TaxID=547 RepID=UPI000467DB23|nr:MULTISPECIES: FdtA/QdtA family cupin domain-containing protein [Enterobacter]MBW9381802.1 WxcM-like domain-containing protein [Enterobacter sp. EC_64]MBW9391921.1 WxcM-like domain-containing protein [Enterobacter roggenkampii]